MKKYTTSSSEFVVRPTSPSEAESLARRLPAAAEATPLPGDPGALLIHYGQESAGDPATLLQSLQRSLGEHAHVYPVLHDANGTPVFPTGRVAVRFSKPATDMELQQFAKKHGFDLVRRNEFQPEQAVFVPTGPATRFLPDAVDDASADENVTLAWPETKGRYTKP